VINLEDTIEVGNFVNTLEHKQLFGAFVNSEQRLGYTADSRGWFDLSLISVYGREAADKLKLQNRSTYQELIFAGFGWQFAGEEYLLPEPMPTDLSGDVAISAVAGPVWPMKNWAFYHELKARLEAEGFTVNYLPKRASLLEHLGDVCNHRCLVGGDSLPMHFALGTDTPCVSLFTCTTPGRFTATDCRQRSSPRCWEIFSIKEGFDIRATTAISLDEVFAATVGQLDGVRSELVGIQFVSEHTTGRFVFILLRN
jgi:hypothetical protein